MKKQIILQLTLLIGLTVTSLAQTGEILAVANGHNYTVVDLDPATREAYEGLPQNIARMRSELLAQMIGNLLFQNEAALRKMSVNRLLGAEIPKRMVQPTESEIKAVYDKNKDSIGDRTLEQVKPQIVKFLQNDSYNKAAEKYVGTLKMKYKVQMVKDVNSKNLLPNDTLAMINGKPLTDKLFEDNAGQSLSDYRAATYQRTYDYLETIIYNELVGVEARKAGIATSEIIAREITNKMREFSDDEREKLDDAFRERLATEYKAKILLKEPAPWIQKISLGNSPSKGNVSAPVTIVMFSDFQCSACGAAHPVLKKIMAEYSADKIRFVVRDFPLTQVHENALSAAKAAAAANAQGKFFEYIDLLYTNQNSLDPASLKRFAGQIGLNQKQFDADFASNKFMAEINNDVADGEQYGVNATPTIYINGQKLRVLSARAMRKAIDQALKK